MELILINNCYSNMEENNTHLYLHTKSESKEVFYVGIGNARRPYRKCNRNKWWHNVVNKYGYEITILADSLTWEQACDMERYLIKYYGRRDLGEGTLVNLTDGGEGAKNVVVSAKARANMSAASKGKKKSTEHRANISAARVGMVFSAETRARNAAANTGELSNTSKLTEDQVIEILTELRDNPYYGQNIDLAIKYGVNKRTISSIKRNRSWKHICRETFNILN